ncbi:hypothetical protein SKAU_G00318290 [Synaphobranchus kaupii]|uniref:Uncharacterized protein n=1 Tax=Synaphobranchus kaupii TaxID=118154 RepID=A0A9Q1IM21_SYNKA|nr:hypothetical protein SKAU_G00318290 [Synaphobranchus kaupii]
MGRAGRLRPELTLLRIHPTHSSAGARRKRHVALGEVTRGARLRDFVTETTASHRTISLPKCTGFTSEQRKVRFAPFWSVMIAGG